MTDWNPNDPCTVGMEWSPTRADDLVVGGAGDGSLSFTWTPTEFVQGGGVLWQSSNMATGTYTDWAYGEHGGGVWMAVGSGGRARSTNDGDTWARTTMAGDWRAVATDNAGNWVTVAGSGTAPRLRYSTNNGSTWQSPVSGPAQQEWVDVAFGDGRWMAVSRDGNDRATQQAFNLSLWFASPLPDSNTWTSITHGDGKFVTVGDTSNVFAYLPDGSATWVTGTFPAGVVKHSVHYANGYFMAVGGEPDTAGPYVHRSVDGITWEAVGEFPDFPGTLFNVHHGNGVWLATTGSTAVTNFRSVDDGLTWTRTPFGSFLAKHGNDRWLAIIAGGTDGLLRSQDSPNELPQNGRVFTYCPTFTVGADDTMDVYRVQDLTAVAPVADTRFISADASFGNTNRVGAQFGVSTDPSSTVATDESLMTFTSRNFYELGSGDPLIPNRYAGNRINATTWSTSTELVHREFLGLPSVPGSVTDTRAASNASWGFHVDSLDDNVDPTRRVLGLTVTALCQRLVNPGARNTEFDQPYRIRFGVRTGGRTYQGQVRTLPNVPQEVSFTWTVNPATGRSWTMAELADFADGGSSGIILYMSRPDERPVRDRTAGAVYRLTTTVEHVAETRVGVATRMEAAQAVGWNAWDLRAVDGEPFTWVKNEPYLFDWYRTEQEEVDRRPSLRPRNLGVRALEGSGLPPDRPQVVETAHVAGVPRSITGTTRLAPAVIPDAAWGFRDGQPHAIIGGQRSLGVVADLDGFPDTLHQFVSRAADLGPDYPDRVRVTVRSQFDELPAGDLLVDVVKVSAVGAFTPQTLPVEVRPDDLVTPRGWLRLEAMLADSGWESLGTDVAYAIRFRATVPGTGWEVLALDTGDFEPGAKSSPQAGLFGGATEFTAASLSLFGGGVDEDESLGSYDPGYRITTRLPAQIGVKPAVPTGFTVVTVPQGPSPLAPPGSPVVAIGWDAHDDVTCDGFGQYEVQRLSPAGEWQTVFVVTDPTVTSVHDVEARRNTIETYRIRHRAAHGFASDWSTEQSATLTDGLCGYTFASNEWPGSGETRFRAASVWYDDVTERRYIPTGDVQFIEFEGVDGAKAVSPFADRLDDFTTEVLVAGLGTQDPTAVPPVSNVTGRRLFDRLLVLSGNKRDVNTGVLNRFRHVAVLDNDGNRWLAQVVPEEAVRTEPSGRHVLRVRVRELTRDPQPVVIGPNDAVLATPSTPIGPGS